MDQEPPLWPTILPVRLNAAGAGDTELTDGLVHPGPLSAAGYAADGTRPGPGARAD